jgi:hypothetical protein
MSQRYSQAQIDRAAELRRDGMSWQRIAAEVGVWAEAYFSHVVRRSHPSCERRSRRRARR